MSSEISLETEVDMTPKNLVKSEWSKNLNRGVKPQYMRKITNMIMKQSKQKCTICLCNFYQGEIIKKLPCNHIFHRDCCKLYLKVSSCCSVCKKNVNTFFEEELKKKENSSTDSS